MAGLNEVGEVQVDLSDYPRLDRLEAALCGLLRDGSTGLWLLRFRGVHDGPYASALLVERNDYS
jgi:hypothetical protein